jgi:hypothetical protein
MIVGQTEKRETDVARDDRDDAHRIWVPSLPLPYNVGERNHGKRFDLPVKAVKGAENTNHRIPIAIQRSYGVRRPPVFASLR